MSQDHMTRGHRQAPSSRCARGSSSPDRDSGPRRRLVDGHQRRSARRSGRMVASIAPTELLERQHARDSSCARATDRDAEDGPNCPVTVIARRGSAAPAVTTSTTAAGHRDRPLARQERSTASPDNAVTLSPAWSRSTAAATTTATNGLDDGFYNPSGNQFAVPAAGAFEALGPAIVVIPQMLPDQLRVHGRVRDTVVDKRPGHLASRRLGRRRRLRRGHVHDALTFATEPLASRSAVAGQRLDDRDRSTPRRDARQRAVDVAPSPRDIVDASFTGGRRGRAGTCHRGRLRGTTTISSDSRPAPLDATHYDADHHAGVDRHVRRRAAAEPTIVTFTHRRAVAGGDEETCA